MKSVVILLAALSTPALALPPTGLYPGDAEHAWWECHVQPATRLVCCRESEGHVLRDNEWRAMERPGGVRVYQVHVGTRWFDVPVQAVINDIRNCGPEPNAQHRWMAKVWYAPIRDAGGIVDLKIYCFIAGTMY
ncbi:MAG: hypothetical protein ACREF3_03350 [Acetobacteraceae bacterium]